jgi:hypothetical protein
VSRILAIVSLCLGWLCANGAIWDAMQVFAWGKMFAGYSASMSVPAALKETFDPSKPCHLCLATAAAKERAKNALPGSGTREPAKFVLALESVETPVFATETSGWHAISVRAPREWSDPVPVPPPRV